MIRYARFKKDPAWIAFILATIHYKTRRGLLTLGSIEGGFFARIAKLAYLGSMN